MEEAYSELYQEFLRLRSLCLRQASLLNQLITALQKQQGAIVVDGDLSEFMSTPVQCSQGLTGYLHEKPLTAHSVAAQFGINPLCRNVETFSDLLAGDMSKLSMNVAHPRKDDRKVEQKHGFPLESSIPRRAGQHGGDGTPPAAMMPATDGPSLVVGDQLVSDVVLHSQVCDFCEAVFPGNTTTGGEFLRHLSRHLN